MKRLLILCSLLAIFIAGCKKNDEDVNNPKLIKCEICYYYYIKGVEHKHYDPPISTAMCGYCGKTFNGVTETVIYDEHQAQCKIKYNGVRWTYISND